MRQHLIDYIFGSKLANALLPDTMENLINAEIEYLANKANPLYDCTGIILLYAKSMEQEIVRFYRALFAALVEFESTLTRVNSPLAAFTYNLSGVMKYSVKSGLKARQKDLQPLTRQNSYANAPNKH